MARMATTCMCRGEEGEGNEGKTTTAFGAQEWLKRAVRGEIETPRLERSVGAVRENEFEANWRTRAGQVSTCLLTRRDGRAVWRTREQRSMTAPASGHACLSVSWPTYWASASERWKKRSCSSGERRARSEVVVEGLGAGIECGGEMGKEGQTRLERLDLLPLRLEVSVSVRSSRRRARRHASAPGPLP